MKTVYKISDTPDWMSKFAGELDHPHEDGYLDEMVNGLSEEDLRKVLQQILIKTEDNSVAYQILKEMAEADATPDSKECKPCMHKKSEDEKEYNINPDKAIIRNHDETPNDAKINY
jgi:hypothetical protein